MASKGYWTAARRRAFKKMRAGLARKLGRGGRRVKARRTRARRKHTAIVSRIRRRVRRNPMTALVANPSFGWTSAYGRGFGQTFGAGKPRRKRRGTKMARRRKRRHSKLRRGSRVRRRRIRRAKRVPKARAHRYYKSRRGRIYLNGKRRRARRSIRRSHRRRNGSMGVFSALKASFVPFATGIVAGGLSAVLDNKLASKPAVKNIVKAVVIVGVAAFVGRKHPRVASAAIGALSANFGYSLATKALGGMAAAHTPQQAVQGLGEMADEYPEMGALLNGGLGALLNGIPDVADVSANYEMALNNMADDDE